MNTEENKNPDKGEGEKETTKEKGTDNGSNGDMPKEEKPERNNSKRTGMPFGFDELFFKCDHHFVE